MATLQEKLQQMANDSAIQVQKLVNSANKMTLDFNRSEAATARKFQKDMSDTSHQREVADLRKAGLNPVLSANSGAQSYTGASASANLDNAGGSVSGLYGSLMSGLVGLQQSQMSSQAQLKAAQLSSDATKFAALQSAQAQKYSADMAYKTQMDKPQGSPFALLDKYGVKAWNSLKNSKFVNQTVKNGSSKIGYLPDRIWQSYKRGNGSLDGYYSLDKMRNYGLSLGVEMNKLSDKDRSRFFKLIYNGVYKNDNDALRSLTLFRATVPKSARI